MLKQKAVSSDKVCIFTEVFEKKPNRKISTTSIKLPRKLIFIWCNPRILVMFSRSAKNIFVSALFQATWHASFICKDVLLEGWCPAHYSRLPNICKKLCKKILWEGNISIECLVEPVEMFYYICFWHPLLLFCNHILTNKRTFQVVIDRHMVPTSSMCSEGR